MHMKHYILLEKNRIKDVLFKLDFDRVHWDLLLEVLHGRNFRDRWIG
jgi:hypothetical protein